MYICKGVKTKTLSFLITLHNSYIFFKTMNNDTGILNSVPSHICIFLGNDKKVKVFLKSMTIKFLQDFDSGTAKVLYQTNCEDGGRGLGR